MTYAYALGGLKVASDIDLPALPVWDGGDGVAADVVIRLGNVPMRLARPDHVAPIFQTAGASEYLMALPRTGRILVRDGSEVTVEPEVGADATVMGAVIGGPIQAVLWHQRGLLPLHASVVVVEGRAVALCGHSTAGKSTLAALLSRRGHAAIADDICIVDARASADVQVLPSAARLRLWRDALRHMGVETQGLRRALAGREKYFFDCPASVPRGAQKLAALMLLSRQAGDAPAPERLRGAPAAGALHGVVHTRRPACALGRDPDIFAALTRLLASGPSVWRLKVSEGLDGLHGAAAQVLAVVEA